MPGTFARVWLVRLKDADHGDENKVFALKILRKVDGTVTGSSMSRARHH
jgi:hypothetical protein